MNLAEATRRRPVLLSCSVVLAIATGIMPEVAHRWLFYVPGFMEATLIVGPLFFVPLVVGAYHFSGKKRVTLWLWLLGPLCFRRLIEFLWTGLLWTLRGGMV